MKKIKINITSPRSRLSPAACRLISEKTGLITDLLEVQRESTGIQRVHQAKTNLADYTVYDTTAARIIGANGKGLDRDQALMSSIGESVERYCYETASPSSTKNATYSELRASELNVLEEAFVDIYPDEFVSRHGLVDTSFETEMEVQWCSGRYLDDGSTVWIPVQNIYRKKAAEAEQQFDVPTTTGVATGDNAYMAVLNGLYECVEHHAFMKLWCERSTPDRIALPPGCELVEKYSELFDDRRFEVNLLKCTVIDEIYSVYCVLTNNLDEEPYFLLSGGASLDLVDAIGDALEEASQSIETYAQLRHKYDVANETDVSDFISSMFYYAKPEHFDAVSFLLEGDETEVEPCNINDAEYGKDTKAELKYLMNTLLENGLSPIGVDLTTRDIRTIGWVTTKVFVPELLRLSLPTLLPYGHPTLEGNERIDTPHPYP